MSRAYFDNELEQLHNDLIKMSSLIEDSISDAIKSMQEGDKELARQVVENDKQIDDMESTIESRCLRLILRQQPVAKDLRAITTAIKMITDMERIGDQASDIADVSTKLKSRSVLSSHIPAMAEIAKDMVNESIRAFVQNDLELARITIDRDDEVDALFDEVKNDVILLLKKEVDIEDDVINIMMIAKYLERIGDHAVNICEWVEFYETGVRKDKQIL